MSFLDSTFGGGQAEAARKAGKARVNALNESKNYYNPYYQAGQQSLTNYQNALNEMQNPFDYYNTVTSNYEPSAGFQSRLNRGLDILNNNAFATGTQGSGASQKEISDYLMSLLNEDQQQYINDINGYRSVYLNGEGNLMNQGYNAAGALANTTIAAGEAQARRYQDEATARSAAFNNALGLGINTAANYATGGLYGVVEPYTSNYRNRYRNQPRSQYDQYNQDVSWNRGGY